MASGHTSVWTRMGSNTQTTQDCGTGDSAGVAGTMPKQDISSNGRTVADVRRECNVWLTGADATYTPPFDWEVGSNFTIVLNATKALLDTDAGSIDVMVEGSVTGGTNDWVTLKDLTDFDIIDGGGAATIGHTIYDLASNGKLPKMRIKLDPASMANTGNNDEPIKVVVYPHSVI